MLNTIGDREKSVVGCSSKPMHIYFLLQAVFSTDFYKIRLTNNAFTQVKAIKNRLTGSGRNKKAGFKILLNINFFILHIKQEKSSDNRI